MSSRRRHSIRGQAAGIAAVATAATLALAGLCSSARADVVWSDFENGQFTGFGALTNSGIKPWSDPAAADPNTGTPSPVNGTVITAPAGSGTLTGSQVFHLTGSGSFNMGQASGACLGFDFLSNPNLRQAFFDNNQIEFDWYPVPNADSTSGWSQIWNVIINSQGGGFATVDGYSKNNPNSTPPVDKSDLNQYYYAGYNGILHHAVINYAAYRDLVLASGNPNGGGWLQLGLQMNPGGGAPGDYYFDNFKFSIAANAWNLDNDGNWSENANWTPNAPNAAGMVASFSSKITAAHTVTVDAAQTVGQLLFNNSNKYTIAGAATLTLDSTGASVGITVSGGSHDITAPLALSKDAGLEVTSAASTLTLSNLQPSTVAITKTGAGVVAVNNVRANALNVNAGTVRVLPDGSAAGASKVTTLAVTATAKLDLANNKLVTDTAAGSLSGSTYSGVQGMVQAGQLITSQSAASAATHLTALGVATGAQAKNLSAGATTTWAGQVISDTSTLVMYTYAGDANLDGKLNGDDYFRIDTGVAGGLKGWFNGDFNYDGKINGDDYFTLDSSMGRQTLGVFSTSDAVGSGAITAVPEPAALGLFAAGTVALSARRRRRG